MPREDQRIDRAFAEAPKSTTVSGVQKGEGGKPQIAVFGADPNHSGASTTSGIDAEQEGQLQEQYEEQAQEEQQYEEQPQEEQQYEEQPQEQYEEQGEPAEGEYTEAEHTEVEHTEEEQQ